MKIIFIFMTLCLLLAVATFSGEILFGEGVEVDAIRTLIKERI